MDKELFIEFVTDSPFNRGYFIPLRKLPGFVNANIGSVMFHSYYAFDKSIVEHQNKYGTLKGYSGVQYPYKLILDIDAEGDIPKAANTAGEIYHYMLDYYDLDPANLQLWFSGGKGFHIHMSNLFGFEPGKGLCNSVKATFGEFFSKWEELIDLMPVMQTGLIRAPWSAHKSGLIKVPVTFAQVLEIAKGQLSPDAIASKENFKKQFRILEEPMNDDDDGTLSKEKVAQKQATNFQQQHGMDKPNAVVTCMQKLLMRGPIKGRRHKDALRLVSNWRRQGIPASFSATMLEEWLDEDDPDEIEDFHRIVKDVYQQQYAYSCNDEVMAEYCDSKCIFFKNKDYIKEVRDNKSMMEDYKNYLQHIKYNGIDLMAAFNFSGTYKIVPGEMVIVTGDTGAGKSAFVQNILELASQKTLYLNLEMHEALIYRRFLQIQYSMSKYEVNRRIEAGDDFSGAVDWLSMLSTSPDISELDRIISQNDYTYVVIDTSDGIEVKEAGNNEYVKLGKIINTLRQITQQRNIITILIHHIKKMGAYRNRITLDDLSGNRANVTKMDHVFVIEGDEQRKQLRSLKTRDGQTVQLPLNFDYVTMRYTKGEFTYEQQSSESNLRVGSS